MPSSIGITKEVDMRAGLTERKILLNPGPATTTHSVKMAQVVPDICPREREFGEVMRGVSADLPRIVHGEDKGYVSILLCGSGTICIDAALSSFLPEGKEILILNNGAYSTRATEVCEYYGLPYREIRFEHDKPIELRQVKERMDGFGDISIVYMTHHETGTGVLNPLREIGGYAHENGAIFVVDTISSFAMIPIDVERDNIDVCMASAQKGIQGMTGLSFLVAKKDLVERSATYPKRSYYCNVYSQYDFFSRTGQMRFTPPVQTIYAARQALDEYFAEGEQRKWERHRNLAKCVHKGLKELGFEEAIEPAHQSQLVVAVKYPGWPAWNFEEVHDRCYERGFTIYPGKIENMNTFRICTLGAIDVDDMERFFAVLKEAIRGMAPDE